MCHPVAGGLHEILDLHITLCWSDGNHITNIRHLDTFWISYNRAPSSGQHKKRDRSFGDRKPLIAKFQYLKLLAVLYRRAFGWTIFSKSWCFEVPSPSERYILKASRWRWEKVGEGERVCVRKPLFLSAALMTDKAWMGLSRNTSGSLFEVVLYFTVRSNTKQLYFQIISFDSCSFFSSFRFLKVSCTLLPKFLNFRPKPDMLPSSNDQVWAIPCAGDDFGNFTGQLQTFNSSICVNIVLKYFRDSSWRSYCTPPSVSAIRTQVEPKRISWCLRVGFVFWNRVWMKFSHSSNLCLMLLVSHGLQRPVMLPIQWA